MIGPQAVRAGRKSEPVRVRPAERGLAHLPLRDQLLHGRDAVHPLRHRGRLPLPGRRDPEGGRLGLRPRRDRSSSSSCCWSRCVYVWRRGALTGGEAREAAGARARSTEPRLARAPAGPPAARPRPAARRPRRAPSSTSTSSSRCSRPRSSKLLAWGAANSMFPLTFGLACCAIEMIVDRRSPRYDSARFGAEALRASPRQADMHHPLGPGLDQDGPGRPPHLRPDAGAAVGDLDGRLLVLGRHVRQLRGRPGRRQVHADRHPRPGLPAAAGGADLRLQQAPAQDPGQPGPGLAAALQRRSAPRSGRATT